MLLEHEQDYGLGMDVKVTVCSWNTNEITVLSPPQHPPSPLQKSVQPHGLLQAPSPTTTTDKEGNTVANQSEERSRRRLGMGCGATPHDQSILKTNTDDKKDIDTVNMGWGEVATDRSITPKEAEERIIKLEHELKGFKDSRKFHAVLWFDIYILVYGLFMP